jgi:hypothetical protein
MGYLVSESDRDALAQSFTHFATVESRSSPLYERFSHGVAADADILRLAAQARAGQLPPLLLFAAVQYLLMRETAHPLAAFYPTLTRDAPPAADPWPLFRAFCLEHRPEISALLATRLVQTNEVRRCVCLLPAFTWVARRNPERPLALIEIGPSAGLNMLWDRYGYAYGDSLRCGDAASPVQIACALDGARKPPLPGKMPEVAYRIGVDLHPVDVRDLEETRWLKALVWPEHTDRFHLLEEALRIAQDDPPKLYTGDALDLLPALIAAAPPEATLCLFHTFVLYQLTPEARERFTALLEEQAAQRDLISIEVDGGHSGATLKLYAFESGQRREITLAACHPHGRWLKWIAEEHPSDDTGSCRPSLPNN